MKASTAYQNRSRFYQWYHYNTIGTNCNTISTIGNVNGTFGYQWYHWENPEWSLRLTCPKFFDSAK